MLAGDLNVREVEMEGVREQLGLQEAQYEGRSWDPRRNAFDEEVSRGRPVVGEAFDRILCRGSVFVEAFMVGSARRFCGGRGYNLSDHYGLLGLVGVHESLAGGRATEVARQRRRVVTRARDVAVAAERSRVEDREREEIRRDKEQQMKQEVERLAVAEAAERRAAKERGEARWALRRLVHGEDALLGPAAEARFDGVGVAPGAVEEVGIEEYSGLSGAGWAGAWSGGGQGSFRAWQGCRGLAGAMLACLCR